MSKQNEILSKINANLEKIAEDQEVGNALLASIALVLRRMDRRESSTNVDVNCRGD